MFSYFMYSVYIQCTYFLLSWFKYSWRSLFSNTVTFTEIWLRILSKKYDVLSNRYLENHYLHQLNDTPNLDYLGHPINAYHFIRHVASGWKRILNDGPQINNWIQKNAGKIVWNNLSNDIGNLKICVAIN